MGPLILLDKSALQALSLEGVETLARYYSIVIPPVLLAEIQGDIVKPPRGKKKEGVEAQDTARKILMVLSPHAVLMNRKALMLGELLGIQDETFLPVDDKILTVGGEAIDIRDQRAKILEEWSRGEFTEEDRRASEEWRASVARRIPDALVKMSREALKGLRRPSERFVVLRTHALLTDEAKQDELLEATLGLAEASPEDAQSVRTRWSNTTGVRQLRAFAPYAYHCARVSALFSNSLITGLVGTRPSNMIDLEYLFYLPFCEAFCSGDDLHRILGKQLLGFEVYVEAATLKADLARIRQNVEACDQTDDSLAPPDLSGSVTAALWDRFLNPEKPPRSPRPSPEAKAKIDQAVRLLQRRKDEKL